MIMNLNNLKLISKKVVVEGLKVVTLTAGVKVLTTLIESGLDGVKALQVEDLTK